MAELVVFVVVACVVGVYFLRRLGTLLAPPVLVAFSLAGASAFAILLDFKVRNGATLHAGFTHDARPVAVIYTIGLVSFFLPWLRQGRLRGGAPKIVGNFWRSLFQLVVIALSFLMLTWILLGNIAILSMLRGHTSIVDHIANIQNLPVGLMMVNLLIATVLAIYFASAVVLEKSSDRKIIIFWLAGLVLCVAALWQGNRQLVLIMFFFVSARYILQGLYDPGFNKPIKILRRGVLLAIGFVAFAVLFSVINTVRLSALGTSSGPFELALYYTWPVYNMAAIHGYLGYWGSGEPRYLLTELLPARLGGKDLWGDLSGYLFEPTSPSGYFSYWYLSYGIAGVAVGGLAFGSWSLWIFRRCMQSEASMQIYVLTVWACATISVYSHFISAAYFGLPLLLLLIIRRTSRVVVKIGPPLGSTRSAK